MGDVSLPVRRHDHTPSLTLDFDPSRAALVLVDCDGDLHPARRTVVRQAIAPVLEAARLGGVRVLFLHQSAYGTGGPRDVTRGLVGIDPAAPADPSDWKPSQPRYDPAIAPRFDEPDLPKFRQDGFNGSHADYYLRSWNVDTIIAVGFWLKCCLFLTCHGARWRNYRVVLLRDCTCPPGAGEDPDTLDPGNPEGGWMRFVFLRVFETVIGYTSTSAEFIAAVGKGRSAAGDRT